LKETDESTNEDPRWAKLRRDFELEEKRWQEWLASEREEGRAP
jgi:hypothetical protein